MHTEFFSPDWMLLLKHRCLWEAGKRIILNLYGGKQFHKVKSTSKSTKIMRFKCGTSSEVILAVVCNYNVYNNYWRFDDGTCITTCTKWYFNLILIWRKKTRWELVNSDAVHHPARAFNWMHTSHLPKPLGAHFQFLWHEATRTVSTPPRWDAVHRRVNPQHQICQYI